ncbi:MAG: DUF6290 family protein [Promethearchaeota archaeon]
MGQINFRISEDEKAILQLYAQIKGLTVTELVKNHIFEMISQDRIDLAFKLLEEGKIGRKKTWKISGLNGQEFLKEWTRRNAEEKIPDELTEKTLKFALNLDSIDFLKNTKK